MKTEVCLTEQQQSLLYYGEIEDSASAAVHLASCSVCRQRLAELSADLDRLPDLPARIDPGSATRLAARVVEHLPATRQVWRPVLGGALCGGVLLVGAYLAWLPDFAGPVSRPHTEQMAGRAVSLPDFELLEELELLENLDLLQQIEDV